MMRNLCNRWKLLLSMMTIIWILSGCTKQLGRGELPKFEGSDPVESSIYVEKIDGLTDDFIRGVDVSSYLSEIECGVVYKNDKGTELDEKGFFEFLAKSGVNLVRIRVWNDPQDASGNTYGGGHNDLATAIKIGQWASQAGLQVMIDFHYSDFWADPAKQQAPKAWFDMDLQKKELALYEYTKDAITQLLDANVNVTMVQTGNETNNGMAGETNRRNMIALMKKGCEAIREVAVEKNRAIKVVVHFTNPEKGNLESFAKTMSKEDFDYDVFAVSYYPYWHGTLDNLTSQLSKIAQDYKKEVMVAETSYLYTDEEGDGHPNSVSSDTAGIVLDYPVSVQGQANEVRAVTQAVHAVGEKGIGVVYWEPAWLPVSVYDASASNAKNVLKDNEEAWEQFGSGWASSAAGEYDPKDAGLYYGGCAWENQGLFDYNGNPLDSLQVFRAVFSGTTKEVEIVSVPEIDYEAGIHQEIHLPNQVSALLNSNETIEINVNWDQTAITRAKEQGAGTYQIEGSAYASDKVYPVICNLEVKRVNYIKNPGFEDADMSMWFLDGAGVDREADNNKLSGEYSLKFWQRGTVSFTASQVVENLPEGVYEVGTNLQGGDAGDNPTFQLFIKVDDKTYTKDTGVSTWQVWENPVITDITIPEGANVTVGVIVEAGEGAWGAFDDFYLYRMDEE